MENGMESGNSKMILLLSYICIASISAVMITPALPHIEKTYALSHGALEWIVSIFLLGYVLGQLIYGPIANRYGRLFALRSGLLLNILGVVICIVATTISSYQWLLLGRLVTALGAASGLVCTFILMNEALPTDLAKRAMSLSVVAFTVGMGAAVVIGGLITQYLRWQDCFWVLLIHGVVMLLLTWQFSETLKTPTALTPVTILRGYIHALKSRTLVIFSLTVGLVSVFAYTYAASAPIYAQTTLSLSPSQYGYWNLLNMLGMLGGGFLSAYCMKKVSVKQVLYLGMLLMAIPVIAMIALVLLSNTSELLFFIASAFIYFFSSLLFASASYFASNAIEDKASASGMMSFINMGSAMMGVVVLGYLPFTSMGSFSVVVAGFYILVVMLIFLFRQKPSDLHIP
jgi:MFS family permease